MGKWYLVRHGQTAWNAEGRIQGHVDTRLDEEGRIQGHRLAERLQPAIFAAAYCSDLARAVETAGLLTAMRSIPLRTTPALREAHMGAWDGLTYQEVRLRYPGLFERFMRLDADVAAPGGESAGALVERVREACRCIATAHGPSEDVLVVAHSGSLRGVLLCLVGLPLSSFWQFRVTPASLSVIGVVDGKATVELWNDTAHLEAGRGR